MPGNASLSSGQTTRSVGLASSELTNDVVRVRVEGDLGITDVPALAAAVRQALDHASLTVVDLRGLTSCDAAGVQALLDADEHARAREKRLVLVPAHADVHRAFLLDAAERRLTFVGTPQRAPATSTTDRLLAGVSGTLTPVRAERFSCLSDGRRKVNNALHRGREDAGPHVYLCECGLLGCTALFEMSADAYTDVHRDRGRRAIVAEHQIPGQTVISADGEYRVVEDQPDGG